MIPRFLAWAVEFVVTPALVLVLFPFLLVISLGFVGFRFITGHPTPWKGDA